MAAIGPARPGATANEANVWEAGRYAISYLDAKHEAETVALRLIARGRSPWRSRKPAGGSAPGCRVRPRSALPR